MTISSPNTQIFAHFAQNIGPTLVALSHTTLAILLSAHIILRKEDTKAATGWMGLVWLSPFLGALLYYVLGVNRVKRKAIAIRPAPSGVPPAKSWSSIVGLDLKHLSPLSRLGLALSGRPLTQGNQVLPLINGDEAYPAMLQAIHGAQSSIGLATYIFDNDAVGQEFVAALAAAHRRGVEVRVMVDATGARYSFPSILPLMKRHDIRAALFMPTSSLRKIGTLNLRCHRKILVVDGRIGFTGGMNLREGHALKAQPAHPIQDLHFRFDGPVVSHIRDTFIDDWAFTTGEVLEGKAWTPELSPRGDVWARGILDGPDENYEKILLTIMGALARAKHSIRILTPYFLPDPPTIKTLTIAAMSGVEIDIVIPAKNNVRLVQWASMASVGPLLTHGVRIHQAPEPFDHSKLILVDDLWSFMGSANWDSRSLQLNFEFNVECYNEGLARYLSAIFMDKLARSHPLTLDDLGKRPLAIKLRDGAVRLLAPYL